MTALNPVLARVTDRIAQRSRDRRRAYLARIDAAGDSAPQRGKLGCTNLAHGYAAAPDEHKDLLRQLGARANIAIVSAYNDMLSAHQPLKTYPDVLKTALFGQGMTGQFAGGVPAMCDGVTQGMPGMELSLFSRDVIAMSTAVALSHDMFDGALYLGVCDKIVPGLLIAALSFGHLPAIFVPAGPMTSGISNSEKARTRQLYAEGKVDRDALLESEEKSYHGPGTCTFYGTANSNQMLMEIMGLHIPGAAFFNPGTPMRDALTRGAAVRMSQITAQGDEYTPVGRMIDERAVVNGIVGLCATGGSTNHTIHLIAIARAAGIAINWDDFAELSAVTPLLARVYPNGKADVNHFQAAGGLPLVIRELLSGGLLHNDVRTVMGQGLDSYCREPWLDDGELAWREAPASSLDTNIVASLDTPFSSEGGIGLLRGNLGRAVVKTSAVPDANRVVEAPARCFDDQDAVLEAFRNGELDRDVVVVVRYQGPRANGMPELHKLTPALGVLQDRGFRVALVTDGRMSGASGKIPAAIHVTPECLAGGPLARVGDGDRIRVDTVDGVLAAEVSDTELAGRRVTHPDLTANEHGIGRELFAAFRACADGAEDGAVCAQAAPVADHPHLETVA